MFKIFKIVDPQQLEEAFSVRKEVFVVEQNVSLEDEYDQYENEATHYVAMSTKQKIVGTARWRKTKNGVKLERFAVLKAYRGMGVGSELLKTILKDIQILLKKGTVLYLHGQLAAVPLYKKFGFAPKGEIFSECNIDHLYMEKKL